VAQQYRDDRNLQKRIDLHARFSTNPQGWLRWLFERIAPPAGSRILEVGCGPAATWRANVERIDPSWRLTLTDFSPGMIDAARAVLGERAEYAVANVEELPFEDASFDVVFANHMLYHVEDRPRALGEIARVLVPGGLVHAATNGDAHLRELRELVGAEAWPFSGHVEAFGLESGRAQLAAVFEDVTTELYEDSLAVTEVEPLVAYVESSSVFSGDLGAVRAAAEARLEQEGTFHIAKSSGVLHGRRRP
jgi:ubiquinone/menaquinone biosynthesis C-methylase UbiE